MPWKESTAVDESVRNLRSIPLVKITGHASPAFPVRRLRLLQLPQRGIKVKKTKPGVGFYQRVSA